MFTEKKAQLLKREKKTTDPASKTCVPYDWVKHNMKLFEPVDGYKLGNTASSRTQFLAFAHDLRMSFDPKWGAVQKNVDNVKSYVYENDGITVSIPIIKKYTDYFSNLDQLINLFERYPAKPIFFTLHLLTEFETVSKVALLQDLIKEAKTKQL
jgi:hypothetical protein